MGKFQRCESLKRNSKKVTRRDVRIFIVDSYPGRRFHLILLRFLFCTLTNEVIVCIFEAILFPPGLKFHEESSLSNLRKSASGSDFVINRRPCVSSHKKEQLPFKRVVGGELSHKTAHH